MEITITRTYEDEKTTSGHLQIIQDKQLLFSATILENTKEKISTGNYNMLYTLSPKFSKNKWEIKVPNRTGIRIHSANLYMELRGCIALGGHVKENMLYNSRTTVQEFEKILLPYRTDKLKITII